MWLKAKAIAIYIIVCKTKKKLYICHPILKNGLVAQLNRVTDYGSVGSRFESWRGH